MNNLTFFTDRIKECSTLLYNFILHYEIYLKLYSVILGVLLLLTLACYTLNAYTSYAKPLFKTLITLNSVVIVTTISRFAIRKQVELIGYYSLTSRLIQSITLSIFIVLLLKATTVFIYYLRTYLFIFNLRLKTKPTLRKLKLSFVEDIKPNTIFQTFNLISKKERIKLLHNTFVLAEDYVKKDVEMLYPLEDLGDLLTLRDIILSSRSKGYHLTPVEQTLIDKQLLPTLNKLIKKDISVLEGESCGK